MSSIVFLKNKKNGKVYAYLNEKVRDDRKGTDVYKRKCIGHLDFNTGEIIPNRPKNECPAPKVLPCGHSLFLSKISKKVGLTESLQIVFPDSWKIILMCSIYCLCEDKPLSNIEDWIRSNYLRTDTDVDIQRITSVLSNITEFDINSFMILWKKRIPFHDFSVLSVSPITSYVDRIAMNFSENIVFDSAVELELCFAGRIPFSYVRHSVGLKDLDEMFAVDNAFKKYGVTELTRFARPSLCKSTTLEDLIKDKSGFSMMIPADEELYMELLNKYISTLFSHINTLDGGSSFTSTIKKRIKGRNIFIHFCYSADRAEGQTSTFLSMIERCNLELSHGHLVPSHNSIYERYFIITEDDEGHAKFELNSDAIMKRIAMAGYDIIISDTIDDAKTGNDLFEINTHAEFIFDNMYNSTDRAKMKLYNAQIDRSRIFIQFLSLILWSEVKELTCGNGKSRSVSDVLDILKHVYYVDIPGRKNALESELNDVQKEILSSAGIVFGTDADPNQ